MPRPQVVLTPVRVSHSEVGMSRLYFIMLVLRNTTQVQAGNMSGCVGLNIDHSQQYFVSR